MGSKGENDQANHDLRCHWKRKGGKKPPRKLSTCVDLVNDSSTLFTLSECGVTQCYSLRGLNEALEIHTFYQEKPQGNRSTLNDFMNAFSLWGIRCWSLENSSNGIRRDFGNQVIHSFQLYTIHNNYTFHEPQLRLCPKGLTHGLTLHSQDELTI